MTGQELVTNVTQRSRLAHTVQGKGVKVPGINILKERTRMDRTCFKSCVFRTAFGCCAHRISGRHNFFSNSNFLVDFRCFLRPKNSGLSYRRAASPFQRSQQRKQFRRKADIKKRKKKKKSGNNNFM